MAVRLAAAGVIVLAGFLYLRALDNVPVYLGWDEARMALQGHSIATTGRDLNGHRTPLFFHNTDPLITNNSSRMYWQPLLIYSIAGVLRFAPLAEWSVRLPIAVLGTLDVWLMFAIARRLFSNPWYAVLAAAMIALTPAHLLFARMATDYFCPVTFALLWLLCVVRLIHSDSRALPAITGLVLGVGLYWYIASWIIMPFFLAVTSVVLWHCRKPLRMQVGLVVGFAVPLLALVPWVWWNPAMPGDTFNAYGVETRLRVVERVALYWDYFNPSYLFFSGGSDPMWATRRAGMFALAVAVLLPCGIWSIMRWNSSVARKLLVVGFLFAPVPIILALPEAPSYATARDLIAIPFGVLLSVVGVEWLVTERGRWGGIIASVLVLSVPVQFTAFARDYFRDYQVRSAFRMDSVNMRDVADYIIASDRSAHVPVVYLSRDLGTGKSVQWKYHLVKNHRTDLWDRTKYLPVDAVRPADVPSGSLLVIDVGNPGLKELIDPLGCSIVHTVKGAGNEPTALILRRG